MGLSVVSRCVVGALASITAATTLVAVGGQSSAAPPSAEPKSLVIGIDGATYATMQSLDLPHIESLQRQGSTAPSSLYANPMAPTFSGPGWATIATGVWPDKHRVRDNAFTGARFDAYPDYLTRMERADSARSTLVLGTWGPITSTVFGSKVDRRTPGGSDAGTTAKAVEALRSGDPDSTFVHLDDVDHAGHDHGAASPEYAQELQRADERIGAILAAVDSRPTYGSEDWLIILTTDHGHTAGGGHGGNSLAERSTFVIARGGGNVAGEVRHAVKITDIAPTVLAHHGISRPASWGLDGLPVTDIRADAFDALHSSLRAAVDEDPGARGWTSSAPTGWRIDNSAMPAGGVTEWRGWSFATEEFWSDVARGQGRESNVRARKVFAVADSDEWDDKSHGAGQFDSTLISPPYDVARAPKATLSFATTYAIDGPQTARVLVSFDGKAPKAVRNYTSAMNKIESIEVPVPSGARTMAVHFHYTGTNSAFWTVDQVAVAPTGQAQPVTPAPAPTLPAPPAPPAQPGEVAASVTHQGKTVTLRLRPASVRGPGFEVLLQKADGSYAKQSAPAPRTYLGSVDGDRAAYASAIRTSAGKLSGQIVFDRGATWFFTDGAVTGTRGMTPPAEYRWPSASKPALNVSVTPGQIGETTRRWDLAFDIDTSWYTTDGKSSVAATLDAVEQAAVDMLATYTSNALLRPALGRVVIRGSAQRTPYTKDGLLGAVTDEWKTNHAGADWDAAALVHGHSGGGVAWSPGIGDKNYGQSVNGGQGEFPTIVARHEIGHNWGAGDNHTNGPEGPTIMSGNQYARFDGTELAAMLGRRDSRPEKFPADAGAYPVALPPYAALDLLDGAFSGVPITARPTANDADANRDALTLTAVDAKSHLGGQITRTGNDVTYVPPAVTARNTTDWFSYVVTDATGKTATGVVITRVSPNTALPPVADWKARDVITGVPYELVNRHTGLLGAAPVGSTSMASLVQRERGDDGTKFTVTRQGEAYRLRNLASGLCADVAGGSSADGAGVLHYGCHASANQQWRVLTHPDGGLAIVGVRSGKCLQPRGGALGAGAELVQTACAHVAAQRWDLRAVPAPVSTWANAAPQDTSAPYALTNLETGLRAAGATVSESSGTDSMPGLVQRAGNDAGSRFVLAPAAGGGHTLRVQSTSRACMQVHWGSKETGVDITTWYCADDADRRWRILANPAGGTSLQNVNSGLCLAATDPADSGPDLVQRECGIIPEFRWNLTKA